eukprot:Opistho-2@32635
MGRITAGGFGAMSAAKASAAAPSRSIFRNWKYAAIALTCLGLFFYNWVLGVMWAFVSDCSIDRSYQGEVVKLTSATAKALEEAKVDYWLDLGTLLGAQRNGRMIGHDSDSDIGIHQKDAEKVIKLFENHPDVILLKQKLEGIEIMRIYSRHVGDQTTKYAHVDLYEYIPKGTGMLYHIVEQTELPEAWIANGEGRVEFEGRTYHAPKEIIKILHFKYGENCLDVVKMRWQDCKNAVTIKMFGYKV